MTIEELTQQGIELLKYFKENEISISVVEFAISLYWHSQKLKNA